MMIDNRYKNKKNKQKCNKTKAIMHKHMMVMVKEKINRIYKSNKPNPQNRTNNNTPNNEYKFE